MLRSSMQRTSLVSELALSSVQAELCGGPTKVTTVLRDGQVSWQGF